MSNQAEQGAYLESGTNELKILEYLSGGISFGINILKTSRVLDAPEKLERIPNSHPSVRGIMDNQNELITVIDMACYLRLNTAEETTGPLRGRILVTEFFGQTNGFLIEQVKYVHTILWKKVFDAKNLLGKLGGDYVIGIVRPTEESDIMLLDYEKIILDLNPEMEKKERQKTAAHTLVGDSRKILIAEDSTAVRDMLAVEFDEKGFEVLMAKDGLEAWNLFEQHQDIVLVISDIEMPQLEGLSLTKNIKAKNPDMPVIVYSSIGDPGMKDRAKTVQADLHITKLNIEELLTEAGKLIDR